LDEVIYSKIIYLESIFLLFYSHIW
jgi:hypothetical protein